MRELLSIFLMPLSILWLLIILALIFYFLKLKRSLIWVISISFIWLLIISTGFFPAFLVNNLEKQYHPLKIIDLHKTTDPVYIMVLGHDYSDDQELNEIDKLSSNSLFRLMEGIRIHRLIPDSKIVFSSGKYNSSTKYSFAMAQAAISVGIDTAFIEKISRVHNTREEAERFSSVFGRNGSVIIVTDAIHMPRAIKLFRKQGLDPIASPTNHLNKLHPRNFWLLWVPSADNINKMEAALHEYAGMLWNYIGGY